MKLTDEALKELEALLHRDYPDKNFAKEELLEIGTRLIRLVELIISQPIPPQQSETALPNQKDWI